MPTPEIHPSTTTTTLPSSLSANQCAPSAGFCGYYPSAASTSTSTSSSISKATLLRLRLHLLRRRSRPVRVSGPFIRGQLHRQQFSVVFICHPISLQLDTRYQ
uniref:GG16492 n=1 Tax=Drosophila erecta TaxID=7220 RepID=B3NZ65_DROER